QASLHAAFGDCGADFRRADTAFAEGGRELRIAELLATDQLNVLSGDGQGVFRTGAHLKIAARHGRDRAEPVRRIQRGAGAQESGNEDERSNEEKTFHDESPAGTMSGLNAPLTTRCPPAVRRTK